MVSVGDLYHVLGLSRCSLY